MAFLDAAKNMALDVGKSALGSVGKATLILAAPTPAPPSAAGVTRTAKAMLDGGAAKASAADMGGEHILQVQYNPASLQMDANAEVTPVQYLQQNLDNGIPAQNTRNPSVVLSVELIFDAMLAQDAFLFDKLRLSAGAAVSDISGLAKAKTGGYTVQPQTNGLLAALFRDSTRTVTFRWADMSFTGELTEANATYTMFSVSGKPIRSVIRINITQSAEARGATHWDTAFDNTFGMGTGAAKNVGRSLGDKFGNLMQIGF
ncbi:MAG: hypothetical protein RRY95_00925 [Oscillospiraceae bacterium]